MKVLQFPLDRVKKSPRQQWNAMLTGYAKELGIEELTEAKLYEINSIRRAIGMPAIDPSEVN